MSDRPNDHPEGAERRSGWHIPESPGRTTESETPVQQSAWRIPSLPRDLSVEPETRGAWHLPKPEDTTYTEEDELVIPSEEAPSDAAVAAPAEAAPSEAEQELVLIPFDEDGASKPVAPVVVEEPPALTDSARAAAVLELMDDDEEDDSFSMSELIALASLADAAAGTQAEETQTDAGARISGATDEFDPSDPVAYARRQLEMLEQSAAAAGDNLEAMEPPAPARRRQPKAQRQPLPLLMPPGRMLPNMRASSWNDCAIPAGPRRAHPPRLPY
ncbi:MAG: hypothetical protein IPK19_01705 [Chloroflexi bacterium]|nr:hypothetical protein [Chloroflexota bacterium]